MSDFQLPEKTHICQVHLQTANLDRALLFYCDALGFQIIECGGRHAALSATGFGPPQIELAQERNEAVLHGQPIKPLLFAIRFPSMKSLAEAHMRAKSMKIPIHGLVHQRVCISFFLSTPDDYVIELYADVPRSAWRWHNGMLMRSNVPVDVKDLGPLMDQWDPDSGMPATTGIGHVDLYVRDLEPAKRYFCDFLGLTATGSSGDSFLLAAGFYHQHIALKKRPQEIRAACSNCGLISYCLEVPSMQTVFEIRQRAHTLGHGGGVEHIPPGMLRMIDPSGCMLEIRSADVGRHVANHTTQTENIH